MGYPGGKAQNGVVQRLANQVPPHEVYLEPFAGGAALLRALRPARSVIAVDIEDGPLLELESLGLPELRCVQGCGVAFLRAFEWTGREFVYCDPPYLLSARASNRALYGRRFEGEDEHAELLEVVCSLSVPVMVSGYWSRLYADRLSGWRTVSFPAVTRGGTVAEEWLWMNYPAPELLHDYRYVGSTFREREKFRRKQARWRRRLLEMGGLERQAMLSVLGELDLVSSPGVAMGSSGGARRLER